MRDLRLPAVGSFAAWRAQARDLALRNVPAEEVSWRRHDAPQSLLAGIDDTPLPPPSAAALNVPQSFLNLAEDAACHSAADVHDLLYALLLRVVQEPGLMSNPADPLLARVQAMAKSVRRDCHKMKAFVRFRELTGEGTERRRFAAWFEPEHYIVERMAGFFTRRFADMDWLIATPRGSLSFIAGALAFSAEEAARPPDHDDVETLWRTYYGSIFNPARLKVKAMTAEMPKKYWKNLPEAALIPDLIRTASERAQVMRNSMPTLPPAHLEKMKAPAVQRPAEPAGGFHNLGELHDSARHCQRCDLCRHATQTVCGEGPPLVRLMFVGEQPGDHEDIEGRPFVGPAGQLFDEALTQAGLTRSAVYVTNAVKHFKFLPRGKRRIHQRPNTNEIEICRWWVTQEIALVQPGVLVAMGATALLSLTGDGSRVMARRGKPERTADGRLLLPTLHPSAILRQPEQRMAQELVSLLHQDIRAAVALAGQPAAASAARQ